MAETDVSVPVTDRAFSYGDGLFETLRYEAGRLWFWPDHYARLTAGMAALHLTQPDSFTAETVHETICRLLDANGLTGGPARIKIRVWRQTGGLYAPTNRDANVLITTQPCPPFAVSEKARVGIFNDVNVSYSSVSAYKTLSALPYVMAGLARQTGGYDDMILRHAHPDGPVAECIASSLFWFKEGVLCTSALETGCVDGILRRQVLRAAEALGQPVNVGFWPPTALSLAEAVFCTNVNGIQWLRQIDQIGTFPAGHPLADALFRRVLAAR